MMHNGIHAGTIEKFAKILYEHKKANKLPVVLVGAGISIESGGHSGFSLMEAVLNDYKPSDEDWIEHKKYLIQVEKIDEKILENLISKLKKSNKIYQPVCQKENGEKEQFKEIYRKLITSLYNSTIAQRSLQEIYGAFHRYLLYYQPSKGYKYFSYLAKKGYFEWILSTNFDPLLEEALLAAGLPTNNFIQFTRRFTDPLELSNFIESRFSIPQVKLFKIHGDLKTRKIDATGESIEKFSKEEETLKKSLIKLIQERDLIVIGHSLNDGAINNIIYGAYKKNEDVQRRLNSIWLLTMKKEAVIQHELLNNLKEKHGIQKNAAINYLEKNNHKSHSEIISYTFDECMEELYNEILKLENRFEYSNNKPLKDHTDIYHISGTTVNKKQLLHLVVAPQHYDKTNYINSKNVLYEDNREFKKAVSPIYFSSLSDAITAQLLHEGLKRNRSNARVHQIMSDFPQVKMPFVRDVFIQKNTKSEGDSLKECKGVRALSEYIYNLYTNSVDKAKPIKIFLDSSIDPETKLFFKNQNYLEMAESDEVTSGINVLLHTMVILAGSKNKTEVVNTKDDADICLSLNKDTLNSKKITICRFIPVAISNTSIYKMISELKIMDAPNLVLLTVGGPEHNKLLELFIALHRWYGGETVFNHSNYFDRAASVELQSGLSLFNEAYVGGIAIRGTDQGDTEEKNRAGRGAFIVAFSIPTDMPWIETQDSTPKIKIVSTIGMSAVGTTLGVAYITFKEKFLVGNDQITFIDIPEKIEHLGVKNADSNQKEFIMEYIKYLQNKPNNFEMLPGDLLIETLLNPIEKTIYESMKTEGIEFDELKGYETHAKLWSLIAEKYLIKMY